MAGDLAGVSSESYEWATTLKDLQVSQIVELFDDGFCSHCLPLLKSRLLSLSNEKYACDPSNADSSPFPSSSTPLARSSTSHQNSSHERTLSNESVDSKNQWRRITDHKSSSPSPVNGKPQVLNLYSPTNVSPGAGNHGTCVTVSNGNPEDEEEWRRFSLVARKKNFVHNERVNGKMINVLQGLELHTGVFSPEEQKKIVQSVYDYQSMGRKRQLMERTYSEPRKWMRGKGRVTIQFGCCYNYAVDKDGNPPGIIRDEEVDPLPPVFKQMIKRMVRWQVLPPTCVPNSCIVNIYDQGDCIPPHIDHHDFLRPFCTVSFLTECNILFGSNLKVSGPGEFSGPVSIPLPVGSVLVLKGNGADVAKHCVPAVPGKRISVTFRRMDESKIPYKFSPDPELLNLKPLVRASPGIKSGTAAQDQHQHQVNKIHGIDRQRNPREAVDSSFALQTNDFPPLGGLKL